MSARRVEIVVVALVACIGVLCWALIRTYPNYDVYYHLVWGREILAGALPSFTNYAAPTEHPLLLALTTVLALVGQSADRLVVLVAILSHVAFTWAVYRLGTAVWDRRAGLLAALLAGSSFALLLYAVRGYLDEPFLALVLWASVLEAERRSRRAVWLLLALAGLLRPEAWLLAGAYWLWLGMTAADPRFKPQWRQLGWVLASPLIWCALDGLVTGNPLYSLTATSALAEELGRRQPLPQALRSMVTFMVDTAREPVAAAAIVGLVVTWRRGDGRSMHVPIALMVVGMFAFIATAALGLSVLPRYLTIPVIVLCLLAGYLMSRTRWLLALTLVGAIAFTIIRADSFTRLWAELQFIGNTRDAMVSVLADSRVQAGRRCGPITWPNYRLVPDTAWYLNARRGEVGARSARERDRGVALFYTTAKLMSRYGFADGTNPVTNAPRPGFVRVANRPGFAAYVSC